MINENTIEAVYPLVEKLTKKGIVVSPLGSTPLDTLAVAGHLPRPTKGVDETFLPVEERILRGSQAKDAFGACHHDLAMDEMVEVIAQTVRSNLDLARNVINPMVKDAVADAEEYLANAQNLKQTHVSIVPRFYAEIWNSSTLEEMVGKYRETPIRDVKLYLGIPHATDDASLMELAKTGASRFDEDLVDFFGTLGDGFAGSIFNTVFSDNSHERFRTLTDALLGRSNTPQPNVLLIHLFARKLMVEVPEGVGAGLEEYRAYMSDILSQSGRMLCSMMRRREADRATRNLITTYPIGRERLGQQLIEIMVNGDLYHQWLKDGGTPEVLMGAFVTDQQRGYTALIENKARYEKEWERQERVFATTQRFNRFNHAVEAVQSAVTCQINEMDEEHRVVQKGLLHQRLKEETAKLGGRFYEDLYGTVRRLICKVIFPHTDGLRILTAIDNVCHENPEIEVREAALLATIEIVATWVAKLCRIETRTV